MALFDSLFQPGSGLLGFLQNNAMSQNYPSGLPSDQAQYGAPQSSPLNAYAAMRSPAPPAPPPQVTAPPAVPQTPQAVPGLVPGFGGSNFFQNLGGAISSIAQGGMNSPLMIQRQQLQAQFEATRQVLMQHGLSPQEAASQAMLATLNPEAAKTILPEALTHREKWGVVGEDPLAGKQYGFVNEQNQAVNGKPIGAGTAVGGPEGYQGLQKLTEQLDAMRAAGATQEQMLNAIPSMYRGYVGGVLSGKALPTNMGRAAIRGPIMTLAHAVDNDFDETQIPTRMKVQNDFAGEGKNGQAIGSFNTAQHHIDKLSDDLETLSKFNGNWPMLNSANAFIANNTSWDQTRRQALQAVNDDLQAVGHEVASAYNAGHLSDHELAAWNKLANGNLPPDQLKQGVADFVDLLNGKRDSLNNIYKRTFHRDAPTIEKEKNAAVTAKVHARLPATSPEKINNANSAAPALKVGESAKVDGVTIKKVKD
jgi:hypothetical protein